MSQSAVLKPARHGGFVAFLIAALERMVAAQSRRFEGTEPLSYRFPPI
jgi:hypothetical protein